MLSALAARPRPGCWRFGGTRVLVAAATPSSIPLLRDVPYRRECARVHARHRPGHRRRLRPRARRCTVRTASIRSALNGREPRSTGRAASAPGCATPLVVAEIAFALRAAGRGRASDSQPRQRARCRDGLRAGARGRVAIRSGQGTAASTARRGFLRRGPATGQGVRAWRASAITDALPLGRNRTLAAWREGGDLRTRRVPAAFVRVVSERYPAAMGIPILAGRDSVAVATWRTSEPVMLVNKTMASALVAGSGSDRQDHRSAVCASERRVVGVAATCGISSLEQPAGNEMYLPIARNAAIWGLAIWSCGHRRLRNLARWRCTLRAAPPARQPAAQRLPDLAADRGSVRVAAALHLFSCSACSRLRG